MNFISKFKLGSLLLLILPLLVSKLGLAQNTDLRIDFDPTVFNLDSVQVGSYFSIQGAVSLDVNSSTVPAAETVVANIEFIDPNGLIISTHTQTWNGFPEEGNPGNLDNDTTPLNQILFQVPWSEAAKWGPNEQWQVVARLEGASQESDLTDNIVSHSFGLQIPNLVMADANVNGTTFLPNDDVVVNATISNLSSVQTQNGVFFPIEARLFRGTITATTGPITGQVLDRERLIVPFADQGIIPTLFSNESMSTSLPPLRLPADAEGNFTIQVIVDPNDMQPFGSVVAESEERADNHLFINFTITEGTPNLQVDPDSFTGEIGSFRGLEPVRIGFTVRNDSNFAVEPGDNFTARVVLSKDDLFSTEDFILREFDLSGNALGARLLPNETIQLDWIQQMPDNLEGDYYLLLHIEETGQLFPLQNTPVITMTSGNRGSTHLIAPTFPRNTERPHVNVDGNWFVYEETDADGIQQIYLRNRLAEIGDPVPQSILVSRSFQNQASGANSNSIRPKISADGSTVVFHSRASDLVPFDENGLEDIFLYSVYDDRLVRLINPVTQQEGNGASYYPDVNEDGTIITFESRASNLSTAPAFANGSRQIHLWHRNVNSPDTVRVITNGNSNSHTPSISNDGRYITYASDANNLLQDPSNDSNNLRDIFVFDADINRTERVNQTFMGTQPLGGPSDQPVISGDGKYIAFRSEATNLLFQGGIAQIVVERGGAGYLGNPSIEINDLGGVGDGASITFSENGINQYGQIRPDGIDLILAGRNYRNPQITVVPDPNFPPRQTAIVRANLVNSGGEVFRVQNPLDTPGGLVNWLRVSESADGVGGNMPSREPTINNNGSIVVYSTQASNFLENNITREDGQTYFNRPVRQAQAQAVLVGGIGEIEVINAGSGYQNGFLQIDDFSGLGSGARASYVVDSFGRISSITIISPGTNYNLQTTEIRVDNPRGGTGFVAGNIRFAKEIGRANNRRGGGQIHQIVMTDHGMGYQFADDSSEALNSLILIDGDGVDADQDGKADAQIDSEKIHIDSQTGAIYLEQTFSIEVLSTISLVNTILEISDVNDSVSITFVNNLLPDSPNTEIAVGGTDLSEIRDQIISIINNTWGESDQIALGPIIEDNDTGGTSFLLTALSGRVTVTNPTSIEVIPETNLLFSGEGFTRASVTFSSPPIIHGFSEVISTTSTVDIGNGRTALSYEVDKVTDDIYLFEEIPDSNFKRERISRSSFGFPVNYRPSSLVSTPSSRFPAISGNGRHIYYSSDASDQGGLVFGRSNQIAGDTNNARDVHYFDRKTAELPSPLLTIDFLFPNISLSHSFAPGSQIPIVAQINYAGSDLDRVELFIDGESSQVLDEFSPNLGTNRFTGVHQTPLQGIHSYQIVAFNSRSLVIGASAPVEVSIDDSTNSLAPVLGLDNLVFDSATISSTIPISITGIDEDDAIVGVQYYIDGRPFGDEILRDARSSAQLNSFASSLNFSSTGVKSIFAIGRDSAGNYVSSAVESISVTSGNSNLSVSLNEGPGSLLLSDPQIQLTLSGTGEIIDLSLALPVGQNFVGPPEVEVTGLGNGAEVEAVIDHNESSITYGMITGFDLINRGQGYEQNSTALKIVPVIRAIGNGTPAEVQLLQTLGGAQQIINLVSNIDGSLRQGNGYTVSPALITPPFRFVIVGGQSFERLPLDGNSRVAPFEIGPVANVFTADPFLIGGFAQAPVNLSYSVSSPEELESLTLIVDGQNIASVSKAPFVFSWIPDEAKVYTIFAAASDFSGNVIMSPPNYVKVEEFRGGGISAELHSDSNVTSAIANSTIFISGEAYSEFGIAEVEFFIDGISKGKAFPEAGSEMFSAYIDLTGLPSGEHALSMIARDYGGNQAGTFERELTNSESKQSQTLMIYPASNNVDKNDILIKFPNPESLSSFSPLSFIPVIADLNVSSGLIGKIYAQVILDGVAIGSMEQFGVEDSLDPQDSDYLSHRFTYTIDPGFTSVGNHRLQLVFYRSGTDKTVLMSEIIEFEVSEYSRTSQNIFLQPFIFESVTSDSTIPVSITGTTDQDNALLAVQYYVDGVPAGEEILKDTNSFQRLNTYSSAISFNDAGVKSIFAIGRDFMGNYLSSPVESIEVTEGSSDTIISFTDGPQSLLISGNEVQLTLSPDGQILQIDLPFPVGENFIGSPYVEVMGAGSGAEITAIVNHDYTSDSYGKVVGLQLINGGQGYLQHNTMIRISPVVRSIKRGTPAELQLASNPESITIVRNADQTLRTGFGYITSPRIVIPPYRGFVQIPRAPLLGDGTIDPATFPILTVGIFPPIEDVFLVGGFTQSPIYFNFSVTNPEQLASLRLIIDGEEEGMTTEQPYTFSWIPDEAKVYTVYAAAEDLFGNVTMSPPNYVKVEEFSGGGISASLISDSNVTAAIANSTIFISGEANSEFGIAEVEFFIDGVSKGKAFPEANSDKFGQYIDLNGLSSGEHTISMIARDHAGNQVGTFDRGLTNLTTKMSQNLLIFPSSSNISDNSVIIKYPLPSDSSSFSSQSFIPVIVDLNVSSEISGLTYASVIFNGVKIGDMNQHPVQNSLSPRNSEYLSHRFTFSIGPDFTSVGAHKIQVVFFNSATDVPVAMSEIVEINISDYAELSPSISLQDFPYENITSTSSLIFSARSSDLDGAFGGLQFFLDGRSLGSKLNRSPGLSQEESIYLFHYEANESGVFTVHAEGYDKVGNRVASVPKSFMVTSGTPPSTVDIPKELLSFKLEEPTILFDVVDGEIIDIEILDDLNHTFFATPSAKLLGDGTGAIVSPILDDNGNLDRIDVVEGGENYSVDSLSLQLLQVRRVVRTGTPAEITTRWWDAPWRLWVPEEIIVPYLQAQEADTAAQLQAAQEQNETGVNSIFGNAFSIYAGLGITSGTTTFYSTKRRFDGSAISGEGYVIAPRFYPVLETTVNDQVLTLDRLPLEETSNGTSRLADISFEQEGIHHKGILSGGFTRAPIYVTAETKSNSENIEYVALVQDGIIVDTDYMEPYTFPLIADNPKDYQISFAVKDFDGNVFFNNPATLNIEEYYGSGIISSFSGDISSTMQIGSDSMFSVLATSEYGISEVEFYIDGVSVGYAEDFGNGRYSFVADFKGYTQGEHLLGYVARDNMGNESGTHHPSLTNLNEFKHKTIILVGSSEKQPPSIFPIPRNDVNGTTVVRFKRGDVSTVNMTAFADSAGNPERVYLFSNGEMLETTNGNYFVEFDENSTLHQNGIFSFEFIPKFEGNYTLLPMVIDSFGVQKFSTETIHMEVRETSTASPSVSMVYPSSDITISDFSTTRFVVNANHNDGSLLGVQFYINGEKIWRNAPVSKG